LLLSLDKVCESCLSAKLGTDVYSTLISLRAAPLRGSTASGALQHWTFPKKIFNGRIFK
jgi:hypothetical protein